MLLATTILLAEEARPTLTPLTIIAGLPGRAVCDAITKLEDETTLYTYVEEPRVTTGLTFAGASLSILASKLSGTWFLVWTWPSRIS